jgi:1-acyl-sn-glycerol-3-phosphate acyltransferase
LTANHESVLDPWFLAACTSRQVHYMAKAELFRNPALRRILGGLGCFPVERGSENGAAIKRGLELLGGGSLVGVFPQGTCLPYRRRPFQRGAARLALESGAPLIPVALVGTERTIQPRTQRIGFPSVTVIVGDPIKVEPQEPSRQAATDLTAQVEHAITELRSPYGEPDHAWFENELTD